MAGGGGYERYAPFVPGVNTRKAFTRYRNQTLTQPNSYGDLAVLLAILDAHGLTATVWVMPRPNAQSKAMTLVPVPGGTGFYDSPCTSSVSKTATALGAAARSLSRTPHPPPPSPSWRRGSFFEHGMCVGLVTHCVTTRQLTGQLSSMCRRSATPPFDDCPACEKGPQRGLLVDMMSCCCDFTCAFLYPSTPCPGCHSTFADAKCGLDPPSLVTSGGSQPHSIRDVSIVPTPPPGWARAGRCFHQDRIREPGAWSETNCAAAANPGQGGWRHPRCPPTAQGPSGHGDAG